MIGITPFCLTEIGGSDAKRWLIAIEGDINSSSCTLGASGTCEHDDPSQKICRRQERYRQQVYMSGAELFPRCGFSALPSNRRTTDSFILVFGIPWSTYMRVGKDSDRNLLGKTRTSN